MLLLFCGIVVYLASAASFRLLTGRLARRWPTLAARGVDGRLRPSRLLAAVVANAFWVLVLGGLVLMGVWNNTMPQDARIDFYDASLVIVVGGFIAWPLLFSLEILAFGVGRPDLAAKIIGGPAADVAGPFPAPALDPDLAAAAAAVRAAGRPLEGELAVVIGGPSFVEDWLRFEAALLTLETVTRERSLVRILLPGSLEFAQHARDRLNALRMAAIAAGSFEAGAISAGQAAIAARGEGRPSEGTGGDARTLTPRDRSTSPQAKSKDVADRT